MMEVPDFEQNHYSRTATVISKNGHDSIRLTNWLAYYDRSYYAKRKNVSIWWDLFQNI